MNLSRKNSYRVNNTDNFYRSESGQSYCVGAKNKINNSNSSAFGDVTMDSELMTASSRSSSTHSGPSSTYGEYRDLRRKLRTVYGISFGVCIGVLLCVVFICIGVGLILLVTIPTSRDVKTLMDRFDTLEENISSLKSDFHEAMKSKRGAVPFLPRSDALMSDPRGFSEEQKGVKTTSPEKDVEKFSDNLMERINQTISALDKDNKEALDNINDSLNQLKHDADARDNQFNGLIVENSRLLSDLRKEKTGLDSKLHNPVFDSIGALISNLSSSYESGSVMIQRIENTTSRSLFDFGVSLEKEIDNIWKYVQDSMTVHQKDMEILKYVIETMVVDKVHKINMKTEEIKGFVKSIHSSVDPVEGNLDSISSEQQVMNVKVDELGSRIAEIGLTADKISERLNSKAEGETIDDDTTKVMIDIRNMQKTLLEMLKNDSQLLDRMAGEEASVIAASIDLLQSTMKGELGKTLELIEHSMVNNSLTISSAISQNFQSLINDRLENDGVQMNGDDMMRDASSSALSSSDIKLILQLINKEFGKGFKMLVKELKNHTISFSPTSSTHHSQPSPTSAISGNAHQQHLNDADTQAVQQSDSVVAANTVFTSKVCTRLHGCTSVEYPARRCYKAIEAAMDESTWTQAKRKCELMGGHLAEVTSVQEYDLLVKSLPIYGNYWIGGTDRGFEGYWHWDRSLRRISLSAWAPGQPNNHGSAEHCLHILHDGVTVWNDLRCNHKMGYVCQAQGNNCTGFFE